MKHRRGVGPTSTTARIEPILKYIPNLGQLLHIFACYSQCKSRSCEGFCQLQFCFTRYPENGIVAGQVAVCKLEGKLRLTRTSNAIKSTSMEGGRGLLRLQMSDQALQLGLAAVKFGVSNVGQILKAVWY